MAVLDLNLQGKKRSLMDTTEKWDVCNGLHKPTLLHLALEFLELVSYLLPRISFPKGLYT